MSGCGVGVPNEEGMGESWRERAGSTARSCADGGVGGGEVLGQEREGVDGPALPAANTKEGRTLAKEGRLWRTWSGEVRIVRRAPGSWVGARWGQEARRFLVFPRLGDCFDHK